MKKNTGNKKTSITEDMERLKQRRDDRKSKNEPKSENSQIINSIKLVDPEYEKLIKKKKIAFNQDSDQVI